MSSNRGVLGVSLGSQPLHCFESCRHGVRAGAGTAHLRLQLLIKIVYLGIAGKFRFRGIDAKGTILLGREWRREWLL
jgi:hypothetical protein